jgi:hypothetical protein
MGAALTGSKGGSAPAAPNVSALIPAQTTLNTQAFNTQLGAGRVNQTGATGTTGWAQDPTTGKWTQTTQQSAPEQAVTAPAMAGAASAVSGFNPANNPTFNPAATEKGIYQGAMSLLQPGMDTQTSALDNSLKAQGYDVNSAGGAQTAENNLQNQQNLVKTNIAGQAQGMAIPQAAQALSAESQAQMNPITQAQGLLGLNSAANAQLPTGNAATPGLAPADLLGTTQQGFANQMSGYNAQQASQSNMMSGLLGLAGTAGMYAALG